MVHWSYSIWFSVYFPSFYRRAVCIVKKSVTVGLKLGVTVSLQMTVFRASRAIWTEFLLKSITLFYYSRPLLGHEGKELWDGRFEGRTG